MTESKVDSKLPILLSAIGGLLLMAILLAVVVCRSRQERRQRTHMLPLEKMRAAGELHPNFDMLKRRGSLPDGRSSSSAVCLRSLNESLIMRENPDYWLSSPDLYNITKIEHSQVEFIAQIAEGNFGKVWRGTATGLAEGGGERLTVAIKTLKADCNQQTERGFLKEAQVISRFKHINIIRLLGVCIPDKMVGRPLCLIFEYMEYGDLLQFLREVRRHRRPTVDIMGRPLTAENAQRLHQRQLEANARHPSQTSTSSSTLQLSFQDMCHMAAQVANGMQFLSQRCYVHRDLAARNCLVDQRLVVKIADFGLSRDIYNRHYYKPDSNWATVPVRWIPPEVLMYGKHTSESDVWSFGVVLWEIFTLGLVPYYELSNQEVVRAVCQKGRRLPQPPGCPLDIYQLMLECWDNQPEERPVFRRLWKVLRSWQPPEDSGEDSSSIESGAISSSLDDEEDYDEAPNDSVFEMMGVDSHLFVTSPHGNRVPCQSVTEVGLSSSGLAFETSHNVDRMDSGTVDESPSQSSSNHGDSEPFSDVTTPSPNRSPDTIFRWTWQPEPATTGSWRSANHKQNFILHLITQRLELTKSQPNFNL